MSNTTDSANTAKHVIGEIGKVVVKEATITVAETVAAVAILTVAGLAYSKWEERKARKALVISEEV
jgi:hypothetical protein